MSVGICDECSVVALAVLGTKARRTVAESSSGNRALMKCIDRRRSACGESDVKPAGESLTFADPELRQAASPATDAFAPVIALYFYQRDDAEWSQSLRVEITAADQIGYCEVDVIENPHEICPAISKSIARKADGASRRCLPTP